MTDLWTQNFDSIIEIGDNHIKYYNEILKISNISRTWVFRFQNVEKRNFEKAKKAYEEDKDRYEKSEAIKRNAAIRNSIMVAFFALLILIIAVFLLHSSSVSFISLCFTGVCFFQAYRAYNRDIDYPFSPPQEKTFPDKFGLSIEMNSGYISTFTAIGNDGVKALRKLQDDIDNADIHAVPTIFNMNDYNITVDNNEGIISTGNYAKNSIYETEREDL